VRTKKTILIVEDDTIDQKIVKLALLENNVNNPVTIANDGEEAYAYLQKSTDNLPGIILLDLNMPKMNGHELLLRIKKDDHLKSIPVVILTSSQSENDILKSYQLSVAGYMIKQVDYTKFVEIIKHINTYWTSSEMPN
jgi:CheY-like chemotaxis protein